MKTPSRYKTSNLLLLLIILLIILIIIFIYLEIYKKKSSNQTPFQTPFQTPYQTPFQNPIESFRDWFTCTLNLQGIDPKMVDEYMKYDNQHIKQGRCKNAKLRINIASTCPTTANGGTSSNCMQTASINSSQGDMIEFPLYVKLENIIKFFNLDPNIQQSAIQLPTMESPSPTI